MSEKPCICRPQVERTFEEMRQKGADETTALDAAFRVYRWYHPENASAAGRALVESWVARGALH
jgi:hypothetical protein